MDEWLWLIGTVGMALTGMLGYVVGRRSARASEAQLEEARLAREATSRPRVHAESVNVTSSTKLPGLVLVFDVLNVGHGHARAVRGYFHHPEIKFHSTPTDEIGDIAAGKDRAFRFGPAGIGSIKSGQTVAKLWIEYADLEGNKWATAQQVLLAVGENTAPNATRWTCAASILPDSERSVGPLDRFHIETHRLRSGDKGIPWPEAWEPLPGPGRW